MPSYPLFGSRRSAHRQYPCDDARGSTTRRKSEASILARIEDVSRIGNTHEARDRLVGPKRHRFIAPEECAPATAVSARRTSQGFPNAFEASCPRDRIARPNPAIKGRDRDRLA